MTIDIQENFNFDGFFYSDNGHNANSEERRVYTDKEREVIEKFKEKYLAATSASQRRNIAQLEMFPDLFNHWSSQGIVYNKAETRRKSNEFLGWLRNTWRTGNEGPKTKGKQYRLGDILWWSKQECVWKEIAKLMGKDKVDSNTPGWFQYRMPATQNILKNMTETEKDNLRKKGEDIAEKGLPEELQRKFAEEKWKSRFDKAAKENFLEMGLLSFSVVFYTLKNGQEILEIHDNISQLLGIHAKSFLDMYEEKISEIQRCLNDYIKTIKVSTRPGAGTGTGQSTGNIITMSDGYPLAPSPASLEKLKKADLEKLYRSYITIHYRLASGVKNRQAPFTEITRKQTQFIAARYLPRSITLKDPRAMRQEDILKFFKHIERRQSSHGIKDAFKFKAVLTSRKKGSLEEAVYKDVLIDEAPEPDPIHSSPTREDSHDGVGTGLTMGLDGDQSHWEFPGGLSDQVNDARPEPDMTQTPDSLPTPEPSQKTTLCPRPKPRPIRKANKGDRNCHGVPEGDNIPPQTQEVNSPRRGADLFLDRDYRWEPRIELDPSLDPTWDGLGPAPEGSRWEPRIELDPSLDSGLRPVPEESSHVQTPSLIPSPARTPRKKADQLALEEAKKIIGKGRRRR